MVIPLESRRVSVHLLGQASRAVIEKDKGPTVCTPPPELKALSIGPSLFAGGAEGGGSGVRGLTTATGLGAGVGRVSLTTGCDLGSGRVARGA